MPCGQKRNQEFADREWRRKEKAQEELEAEAMLRKIRLEQVAFKEHTLAVQVQRDRDDSRGFSGRRAGTLGFLSSTVAGTVRTGGQVPSGMSIDRCAATLTALMQGILPQWVTEIFQRHLSQEFLLENGEIY